MLTAWSRCAQLAALVLVASSSQAQEPAATSPQQSPAAERQFPPEVTIANEAFDREDWAAAVDLYRKAIDKGYAFPFVQMRTGYALHVQGQYREALPYHLKAGSAQMKAIRVDGLYNAACAYALLGERDKAIDFLNKAIDAGFLDRKQIDGDQDMASLRDDAEFQRIVAGISVEPTLGRWMDFIIGEWEQADPQNPSTIVNRQDMTRPLAGSLAIVTTSRNIGGGQWTGLAWPDSDERVWRWTTADGLGTTQELVGRRNSDGSMTFEGRDVSPTGPNNHARFTYTSSADGRVLERVEVSTDGKTWSTHHEAWYVKKPKNDGGQDASQPRPQ